MCRECKNWEGDSFEEYEEFSAARHGGFVIYSDDGIVGTEFTPYLLLAGIGVLTGVLTAWLTDGLAWWQVGATVLGVTGVVVAALMVLGWALERSDARAAGSLDVREDQD